MSNTTFTVQYRRPHSHVWLTAGVTFVLQTALFWARSLANQWPGVSTRVINDQQEVVS